MKTLIIILTLTVTLFCQNEINKKNIDEDPMLYFPHNDGDVWEYYDVDEFIVDTIRATSHIDSIDFAGNIYVSIKHISLRLGIYMHTDYYKIDTLNNVWGGYNVLSYKLYANLGDQWVAYTYGDSGEYGYEIIRVVEEEEGSIFGIQTNFKTYLNFYSTDSTDTIGMSRSATTLAKGFGKVFSNNGFITHYIRGSIINGTKYGTVTSVKDLSENTPKEFNLYQNYPNPFNPATTIEYEVGEYSNVNLKVYDLLGSEVAVLVNEEKHPGKYSETFNGNNLVSGVYFYKLTIGGNTQIRKMILLR
jgi:hypothetical protein